VRREKRDRKVKKEARDRRRKSSRSGSE
jgi:hypothetical protein